jgi:hypothetical protein
LFNRSKPLSTLQLRNGAKVSCGHDADGNWISVKAADSPPDVLKLPRWAGSAPAFSPGCRWLVSLTAGVPRVRGSGEHFEDVQDDDATERIIVDWAQVHLQHLPDAVITTASVGVEVSLSTDVDVINEWETYDAFCFQGDDAVVLDMPWGENLTVRLPPEGPITALAFKG